MFCSDCGTETDGQSSFCAACGHDLRRQIEHITRPATEVLSANNSPRSGFWRRFAAHVIDVAFIWSAMEFVWGTLTNFFWPGGYGPIEGIGALFSHFFLTPVGSQSLITALEWSDSRYWYGPVDWWLYAFVGLLIPTTAVLAYYVIGTTIWGRTLGKAALGIRVVGPDGTPPGVVRTIVRETFGKFLSGIFWIGYLMAAGNQKLGLHDRIAGTEVEISALNRRTRGNLAEEDAR